MATFLYLKSEVFWRRAYSGGAIGIFSEVDIITYVTKSKNITDGLVPIKKLYSKFFFHVVDTSYSRSLLLLVGLEFFHMCRMWRIGRYRLPTITETMLRKQLNELHYLRCKWVELFRWNTISFITKTWKSNNERALSVEQEDGHR